MEEPQANAAPTDSEHYRAMARKLRKLGRELRFAAHAKSYLILPCGTSDEPTA
jgi:hypothetical protein